MKQALILGGCVVLAGFAGSVVVAPAESLHDEDPLAALMLIALPVLGLATELIARFGGALAAAAALVGGMVTALQNESSVGGSFAMGGAFLMAGAVAAGALVVWVYRGAMYQRGKSGGA